MIGVGYYLYAFPNDALEQIKSKKEEIYDARNKVKEYDLNRFDEKNESLNEGLIVDFEKIEQSLEKIFNKKNDESLFLNKVYEGQITGPRGGTLDYTMSNASNVSKMIYQDVGNLDKYMNTLKKVINEIDSIHTTLKLPAMEKYLWSSAKGRRKTALGTKKTGVISIPSGQRSTLNSTYDKLRENIQILKSLQKNKNIKNDIKQEDLSELLKSINSCIYGVRGILYEATSAKSLLESDNVFLQDFNDKLSVYMTGSKDKNIDKQITKNKENIKEINSIKTINNNPKVDILLQFEKNKASIGLSMKKSQNFNSSLNRYYDKVGLGTAANLLTLIFKNFHGFGAKNSHDLYYWGALSYSAFGKENKNAQNKGAELKQYWKEFLNQVALLNVLDFLSGSGEDSKDFAQFLIVNDRVYFVKDIINKLYEDENMKHLYGYINKKDARARGTSLNRMLWKNTGNIESDKQMRSEELYQYINSDFKAITLSVKIDIAFLKYIKL